MISYTRQGDEIILQMSILDWERFLLMIGIAAGAAKDAGQQELFWDWIKLANEMNRTNPAFDQYKIPENFK